MIFDCQDRRLSIFIFFNAVKLLEVQWTCLWIHFKYALLFILLLYFLFQFLVLLI